MSHSAPPQTSLRATRLATFAVMVLVVAGCQPTTLSTSPLLGRPAPEAQLDMLDGTTFDIAQHKGEQVVMLDFWATWCGPCVRAMPAVAEVYDQYKDQGLVFCAVNQGESEAEVESFLQRHNLDIPVGLDRAGTVASSYGVRGIPTLVLIGQDGTVQSVHVGAGDDIKQRLRRELDALLAGDSLVKTATAAL